MRDGVIWERSVDHETIARRRGRFLKWFCIPAALCLLVGLVFAGWKNAIGIAIVLGALGMLVGSWVRFTSLSEQANPVLEVERGLLVLGRASVHLEDVTSFTTFATSIQTSVFGDRSRLSIGKALFQTRQGLIEFGWPKMNEAGIESVREALGSVLPNKWVEPEEMIEVRPSSRGRRSVPPPP